MSVLGAFNSAISGMTAQAKALSNISQNIANSSTVGYKGVNTQFLDQVLTGSGADGKDISDSLAGVSTVSQQTNTVSGQAQSTSVSTDIAINGNGFMVVNTNANSANGVYMATRAGSFRPDANGNLVNAAGYYLQGVPLDASGAAIAGNNGNTLNDLSTVNVNAVTSAVSPTTSVTYYANLPSTNTGYFAVPPTPSTTSVDYYDQLGTAHAMQLTFTPSTAATSTSPQTNTWTMTITDPASSTPTTPIAKATITFNGSGPNAGTMASVTPITTGTPTPGTSTYDATKGDLDITTGSGTKISVNIGTLNSSVGMSQFDGAFTTNKVGSDGSSYGTLTSISIDSGGVVQASFSNGYTRPIYQMKLANVENADGLGNTNGDAYTFTQAAGTPTLNNPGSGGTGQTEGGSLEASNVDITTQLTNLIETQRAYSSNATVIQTGNQMLQVADQLRN